NGANFTESYNGLEKVIKTIRKERRPFLVHAKVPLLNHHTSGVRMEWYRDDLEEAKSRDPYPVLKKQLQENSFSVNEIEAIEKKALNRVKADFEKAYKLKTHNPKTCLLMILHLRLLRKKRANALPKMQKK